MQHSHAYASQSFEQFADKFRLDELSLFHTSHWSVSVRPTQLTFGSLILTLLRPCMALGELTTDEDNDFTHAASRIEDLLSRAVGYERINYLCLMMVDHHVHFHVIPRFSRPFVAPGTSTAYIDAGWPGPPDFRQPIDTVDIEHEVHAHLAQALGD